MESTKTLLATLRTKDRKVPGSRLNHSHARSFAPIPRFTPQLRTWNIAPGAAPTRNQVENRALRQQGRRDEALRAVALAGPPVRFQQVVLKLDQLHQQALEPIVDLTVC